MQSRANSSPPACGDIKISFVSLVLNGMPFMEHVLASIYDYAHEIIISEGAVENCLFAANLDGSSLDGTVECIKNFPDPRGIIQLIQAKWPEKVDMENAALERATGDYIWIVASDEVYSPEQIQKVITLLKDNPDATQVDFVCNNFWKGFDYVFESPLFFEDAHHYRRIYKFKPGARFSSHRPPVLVYPGESESADRQKVISGHQTMEAGIRPFHYSYVLDLQVAQKIELYRRYGWGNMWNIDLEDWYENCFLAWTPENRADVEKKYGVWTGDPNSYTRKFEGEHPEVMREFIAKFKKDNSSGSSSDQQKYRIAGQDSMAEADLTQIDEQSEFARSIRRIVFERNIKKVIETGTYLGKGTTRVIASALREKARPEEVQFFSIEVNPNHYQQAISNLGSAGLSAYVRVLLGLSVPRSLLPTIEEIQHETVQIVQAHGIYVDHQEGERALLYYKETDFASVEDNLFEKAFHACGNSPDFIVLDSGGHMGRVEFLYVLEKVKKPCIIALDDINHIKHHKNYQSMKQDPRFKILYSGSEKFGFCIAEYTPETNQSQITVGSSESSVNLRGKQIVFTRGDSIGDALLAASMIEPLFNESGKKLHVVCQQHLVELYERCPFVDKVIGFNNHLLQYDQSYVNQLQASLHSLECDIVLQSVFSRTRALDFLTLCIRAKEYVAFEGDCCNQTVEEQREHNQYMTSLLPNPKQQHCLEIVRHQNFLKHCGIHVDSLFPKIWLDASDEAFAVDFFKTKKLDPDSTIVLCAGAQFENRHFADYGKALRSICEKYSLKVLAVGTHSDAAPTSVNLADLLNLSVSALGETSLCQTAAIMKRARLVVGAETGGTHLAAAVGTPHVVVLGGGSFGRFMPYSELTSLLTLPLNCFGCCWNCVHCAPHCIRNIQAEALCVAIEDSLKNSSDKPRMYLQAADKTFGFGSGPEWTLERASQLLDLRRVKLISI